MPDQSLPPSRRFNEKEVADIIKRASELQQDEAPGEATSGMSLIELEQVAREAGLDPALVRRAAADMDSRVSNQQPSRFIGAPTALHLERTIEGEVPVEEYEPLVLEMQRVLGANGTATTLGRTLQWTMSTGGHRQNHTRSVQVMITPRKGRTTIRVEESLGGLAGGLFGGLMGGVGGGLSAPALAIGISALHSPVAALGMMGGVVGGAYLLARTIFGRIAGERAARLQELMSRLSEQVAAAAVVVPDIARPVERPALERGG